VTRQRNHEWFLIREVVDDVWLLGEPGHVNSWLVIGSERSALVDTGLGFAPLRPVVESLTRTPVFVINTHHHLDHVGGNHEFDDVSIHRAGAALLEETPSTELVSAYLNYTRGLLAAARRYRAIDRAFFHLLTADADPRNLPAAFDANAWEPRPSRATTLLRDGTRLDLGGRCLTVLHTPGHSEDSICVLLEDEGLLFTGDTVNTGPIYAQFPDSDLSAFAQSTQRLSAMRQDVSRLLVSHFGRVVAEPRLLAAVADGFASVAAGEASLEASTDCLGMPVLEAAFDDFSILLPAETDDNTRIGEPMEMDIHP